MSKASKWRLLTDPGDPARWAKACGLVQMYVQVHPFEVVATMRFRWLVIVSDKTVWHGTARSALSAQRKADKSVARGLGQVLIASGALKPFADGYFIKKARFK